MSCTLGIEQSCDECRMCIPGVKKKTNGERIRSMTDEELADFIERFGTFNQPCNISKGKTLEWLQSEVEE